MKVVTILIPSLHGLRQKCLGVYSLPFASVTRKKKNRKKEKPAFLESRSLTASLSINQFSYFHMLFSHSAVPNFPIRSTIPRKLPRTWQNAIFEKQPFYIKLKKNSKIQQYKLLVITFQFLALEKFNIFIVFLSIICFFLIMIITYFKRMNNKI